MTRKKDKTEGMKWKELIGGQEDFLRPLVREVIQQALEVEMEEVVEAGTSMASPFIAGIVALLLQSAPTITPEAVKVRLKAASRIPHKAAGTFANGWGFGLIDGNRL